MVCDDELVLVSALALEAVQLLARGEILDGRVCGCMEELGIWYSVGDGVRDAGEDRFGVGEGPASTLVAVGDYKGTEAGEVCGTR